MHAVDAGIYSVIGVLVLAAVVGPALPDATEDAAPPPAVLPHGPPIPVSAEVPDAPPELPSRPERAPVAEWNGHRDDEHDDEEEDDHEGGKKRDRRGKG